MNNKGLTTSLPAGSIIKSALLMMDAYVKARWKRLLLYNAYFRRSGFYGFAFRNLAQLTIIIGMLALVFSYVERYIIDLGAVFEVLVSTLDPNLLFLVFFISESFLGLLPPDFFILWTSEFDNAYELVTLLAILSYAGGVASYYIGRGLSLLPKVSQFIARKYRKNFTLVRKWGGIFIVLAAMTPLPYAMICMMAGLLRFPVPLFLAFSTTRILRFYIYAFMLFAIV